MKIKENGKKENENKNQQQKFSERRKVYVLIMQTDDVFRLITVGVVI